MTPSLWPRRRTQSTARPAATRQRSQKVSIRSCETRSKRPDDACTGRSSWDRRRGSSITCWDAIQQSSQRNARRPESSSRGLAKSIHHAPCSESPASKQTDNQRYVLLVRTDSEKHVEFDLKRRLLAAMTHEMEEESLSARRVQRRSWRPGEGNSSSMSRHCRESQACLLDDLRRRKGDMTQPFRSRRSDEEEKQA